MGGGARGAVARVMGLVVRPAAVADLQEIRQYYDAVQAGLSGRFATSLDELFARLEEFPRSAPVVAGYTDVRRAVVRGFPCVVFYRHQPDRIDVLRVLHTARSDADSPPGGTAR
jgi:plasmid stabilization system protein ParE